jgi:hypothetical protein
MELSLEGNLIYGSLLPQVLQPGLILWVQKVHADRVQTQLGALMFV